MKAFLVVALALLTSCSIANVFRSGNDDMCRYLLVELDPHMEGAIARESRQEPPQGALTQGYSRGAWDAYWNHRIYHLWDVGPSSCNGTYEGPSGPEIIRRAVLRRQEVGLPSINLEERNRDKSL
ncbi:hypothetical protein H0E84_15590 [Luteimonas sp. SJ-92]|uniref:Uncharacterized protein n=1 Tax=Luteimonas salinisoli TaxID=2752307 RepID=A0A853JEP4_9GAMM|nr:hypothetical protein [Luteimonas salinisoli]NZA27801.1 hypothetical protein [Luteimonas salinisoli]